MDAVKRIFLTVAAVVVLATACSSGGSSETHDDPGSAPRAESPDTTTVGTDDEETEEQGSDPAVVARTDGDLTVHDEPSGAVTRVLPATTDFGSPRALLVTEEQEEWLEVALPERPNGTTGWIARTDVELHTVDAEVRIDLDTRTLTLLEAGRELLSTPVAIGTADNPTPTGEFYVVDKLAAEDPDGPYGPFAFGLSAYSETLTEFAGGDGQVGIHGTDSPDSIGRDVSHGCIRVPNQVAELLNERLRLGTPVTITG